jgi:hypothetical protein
MSIRDKVQAKKLAVRLVGQSKSYRPTRRDYFVNAEALTRWLTDHRLPISDDVETNAATMEAATGG